MTCCGAPVADGSESPEQRSKTFGLHTYGQTFGAELGMQACMVVQGIITARALAPAGRGELAALLLWPRVLGWIGLGGRYPAKRGAIPDSDNGQGVRGRFF